MQIYDFVEPFLRYVCCKVVFNTKPTEFVALPKKQEYKRLKLVQLLTMRMFRQFILTKITPVILKQTKTANQ